MEKKENYVRQETETPKEREYFSLVTDIGNAAMMQAVSQGKKVEIKEFAVGDGGGNSYKPDKSMTELKNEVWRGQINYCKISDESENVLIINAIISGEVGGFTIREMGVYDTENKLIAICNTPETPKVRITDGVINELNLLMEIVLTNDAFVELKVNQNIVTATKQELEDLRNELKAAAFSGNYNDLTDKPKMETMPGIVPIEKGGTGASDRAAARTNLGMHDAAIYTVADNCTTTAEGFVLNAKQAKILQDKISNIHTEMDDMRTSFQVGCDTISAALTAKDAKPTTNSPQDIATAINNISAGKNKKTFNTNFAADGRQTASPTINIKSIEGWEKLTANNICVRVSSLVCSFPSESSDNARNHCDFTFGYSYSGGIISISVYGYSPNDHGWNFSGNVTADVVY